MKNYFAGIAEFEINKVIEGNGKDWDSNKKALARVEGLKTMRMSDIPAGRAIHLPEIRSVL